MQTTNRVLMVSPTCFAFNEQTAANNVFQQHLEGDSIAREALAESDAFVALLRLHGVQVMTVTDTPDPPTPDAVFPNNTFSTHRESDGTRTLVLYPMFAPNRRLEREKLLPHLEQTGIDRVVDLTTWESKGLFLEGTGSLILDRQHRHAFACSSPRTSERVLQVWAEALGYDYTLFDSFDSHGMPIYHTNVMMHVGTHLAVVCMESVTDNCQRQTLAHTLSSLDKEILPITLDQVSSFAGNMLEVQGTDGTPLLVMSDTALRALTTEQRRRIEQQLTIVAPKISTIERVGGGSARCMMAEIF